MSNEEKIERIATVLVDIGNAFEALGVQIRHSAAEIAGVSEATAVKEETFSILTFELQKSERLGEYATASKKNNVSDKWDPAFNILRQANATINNRYHGRNHEFAYWIYQERIFRQKLKTT